MPELSLDQHQLDLIGLGLVALAAFMAFVFYLGWDGGKVGEGLASVFVFLFGGVGYLVPVVMFGTGAILVLKPLLPSVRPFRSGAICLLLALMLGLAAGSFGLGPSHPARHGFFHPAYFRHHGGLVGDGMYFVSKTLFSSFGAHIIFVFLMLAGVLLLTGGSIAGILSATRAGVMSTTQRIRGRTGEFEAAGRCVPPPPHAAGTSRSTTTSWHRCPPTSSLSSARPTSRRRRTSPRPSSSPSPRRAARAS
jgi:DNA segregation ATPase FtsK/SpoIIIE, S-DNA-T family